MKGFRVLLLALLLLVMTQLGCSLNDEGRALLQLKDFAVDGSSRTSWNPCGWIGVACENGKVVSLATMNGRKLLSKKNGDPSFMGFDLPLPEQPVGNAPGNSQPTPPAPSPQPAVKNPPPFNPTTPPHNDCSHPSTATKKSKTLFYSSIVIGVALIFIVLIVLYSRYNKVVTVKPWATGLSGQLQKAFLTGVPALKRQEIEAACEDFSNIIGSLGNCIMYKGTLSSGTEIAVLSVVVKSSKDWSTHAEDQFNQKIAVLSKVNHKNFVNLLGYCSQEEPFTRMMVFEYAPNGTLYDHLHNEELEALSWGSRLRIAMGIAYCLDYMLQLSSPVILGSLSSKSIHLTDDYAAKVADMELFSEIRPADAETVDLLSDLKQTRDQATVVYEFGLLLLEMISGRIPNCGECNEGAVALVSSDTTLKVMVDPGLKIFQEEDAKKIIDEIQSCLNPDPSGRPTLKDVTGRLRKITAVNPEGATPKLSPLWWAELEIISNEAN